MRRGFILQPTYRIESGRPVVHLFGRMETGESFLVRDDRELPHFFVRRDDGPAARRLGAEIHDDGRARETMTGEPVLRIVTPTPGDVPPLRERLAGAGIVAYEADVRFAYRYLIDRGIRGSIEISGESRVGREVDAVFDNPEVRAGDWLPRLRTLSIDIETDPTASRLFSVALAGCGAEEVLLLTPPGFGCPEGAVPLASESELLAAFERRVREIDPDVITGWNVIDFDLAVLQRLAEKAGIALALGRGPEPLRVRTATQRWSSGKVQIPGRLVLDGMQLLRGAFVRMDSYGLNAVARQVLGKGKTITGPDRVHEIERTFAEDRDRFVAYNLNDARLVLEILDALHLLPLTVERSRLTGMPPDRVSASIAAFDFLYLSELSRRGVVAPSVRDSDSAAPSEGGHVLDPAPGLYRNVLVLDFQSLYPSLIRTFQIDPLGYLPDPGPDDDPVVAPNGAAFRRAPGILPRLLDELLPRREAAQAAGDTVASQAIKILMNSFYGVLGTPACRFASSALASAITSFGREVLLWCRDRIRGKGHDVLYGDTDSLFVLSAEKDMAAARRLGDRLIAEINDELAEHVRSTWRVQSRLRLEFDRLYLRLLLPLVRHGSGGARKRYAGLAQTDSGPRVVFTGMEVVRRDWTDMAKQVQRELYGRLFSDQPVADYLQRTVADLRAGSLDRLLVYRKALRKNLDAYTASTPPHVVAARKMHRKPGRIISYVITVDGPEPADERRSDLDREHYVQKQVRAVSQPVLQVLDLDFDRVVGDDAQMTLF